MAFGAVFGRPTGEVTPAGETTDHTRRRQRNAATGPVTQCAYARAAEGGATALICTAPVARAGTVRCIAVARSAAWRQLLALSALKWRRCCNYW